MDMADHVNPRAHACQNCVKAKAKCYGQTDGRCERCKRLDKHCAMQDRTTQRPPKPSRSRRNDQARQIAQLEQKLNGIVSLLGTSHRSLDDGRNAITPESTGPTSSASISTSTPNDPRYAVRQGLPSAQGYQAAPMTLESEPTVEVTSFAPSETSKTKSPDDLLDIFHRDMAHQVPFISLPSQMSAQALSRERPFLYSSIMTVASYHDSLNQLQMGRDLVKCLTERLIILGEKSMDLLQGLLVYINWYNNLFHTNPQMNTLLGLVFSLIVDLNLYMPLKCRENHEKFVSEMKVAITCNPNWTRHSEPSREERRAVLGCFYLFSCVSSKFRTLNPLQWTDNIQQCYEEIMKAPDNENDIRLVHLLDLQRIAENTKYIIVGLFQSSKAYVANGAINLHLKLLVSALQKFKATLPAIFQQDSMMLMHYHAVEVLVFELCFFMPPTVPTQDPSFQRADAVLKCLGATRALVDTYLSLDLQPHISFSSVSVAQIYLAMATLSKLVLFRAEEWEVNYFKPSVDLSALLDGLVTRTEERSSRYDLMETQKPWLEISRRIRQVRVRFNDLLSKEDASSASIPSTQPSNGLSGATFHDFHLDHFGLLDDRFWQTMLADS